MTPALQKMWISFIAMGFMVISIFLIYLSRYNKLKGFWRVLTAIIAYILIILATRKSSLSLFLAGQPLQ